MPGYKWCIVSQCANTSVKTPEKLFFIVPKEAKTRKRWIRATRRANDFSPTSSIFVCEDHFNLEEDMENYRHFITVGGPKFIKKNVVPHIFHCQKDRKRRTVPQPRLSTLKRQRRNTCNEAISAYNKRQSGKFTEAESLQEGEINVEKEHAFPEKLEKGVQAKLRLPYRSVGTQTSRKLVDAATSPIETLPISVQAIQLLQVIQMPS